MTNAKSITWKLRLTPLCPGDLSRSDRDRLFRAEGRLFQAQREIARLRAGLAEAERGEQLRREALFQLLDEREERIQELERELSEIQKIDLRGAPEIPRQRCLYRSDPPGRGPIQP